MKTDLCIYNSVSIDDFGFKIRKDEEDYIALAIKVLLPDYFKYTIPLVDILANSIKSQAEYKIMKAFVKGYEAGKRSR